MPATARMATKFERQRTASAHFERVARALADTHIVEPRPKSFAEVLERMYAIDPRCGMGTRDPLGGDWDSHLAYLHNRQVLIEHEREQGLT